MTQVSTMRRALEPAGAALPVGGGSDRLDSWKEVATYLKRGARTVQRWERAAGLPVHRLRPDKLGPVYAYRSELDAWWSTRGAALERESGAGSHPGQSVAVLPFVDMSREQGWAYFCDGMAEEIIHALSPIGNLQVASRTSSFQFRSAEADSREIGRRLGVGTLLEGSVRSSGEQVRIAVQLIDVESGFPLWSGSYDRELGDVLAIQDEVAKHIAAALATAFGARVPDPPALNTLAWQASAI